MLVFNSSKNIERFINGSLLIYDEMATKLNPLDDPDISPAELRKTPEWKALVAEQQRAREERTYAGLSYEKISRFHNLMSSPFWGDQKECIDTMIGHCNIPAVSRLPKSTGKDGTRFGRLEFAQDFPAKSAKLWIQGHHIEKPRSNWTNDITLFIYPDGDVEPLFRALYPLHELLSTLRDHFSLNLSENYHQWGVDALSFKSQGITYTRPFTIDSFCQEMWTKVAAEKKVKQDLESILSQLFPSADSAELAQHIPDEMAVIGSIKKSCSGTYTGVVVDYESDGIHYFRKIGEKGPITTQWTYDTIAWRDIHPNTLMRAITPKPNHLKETPNMASMESVDTAQGGTLEERDLFQYLNFRRTVLENATKRQDYRGPDLDSLFHGNLKLLDPYLADAFNLALSHSVMRDYGSELGKARFPILKIPEAMQQMFELACSTGSLRNGARTIVANKLAIYAAQFYALAEYDDQILVTGQGDPKRPNIETFPTTSIAASYGVRVLADSGQAGLQPLSSEIAKMHFPQGALGYHANMVPTLREEIEKLLHPDNPTTFDSDQRRAILSRAHALSKVTDLRFGLFDASHGVTDSFYLRRLVAHENTYCRN